MKKVLFVLFSILAIHSYGQNVDYNKIILPDHIKDADFGEKLVQIAWRNNPTNDVAARKVNMAKIDKKRFSIDWLNFINFQTNINSYTIKKASSIVTGDNYNTNGFYPLYNIRLSLNLGNFFTIPYDIKKSKELIAIAESDLNSQKLQIRNSVLKAYNDYIMLEKSYKIQTQMLSDTENSHRLIEEKFKNGEVNFEFYVGSFNNLNRISVTLLQAENDYKNAKLDLEQFIGMKLEDVR